MKRIEAKTLEAVHTHTHTHTLCLLNKEISKKLNKIEIRKIVDKT